ncbi:MAG: glycosyltransferase, partial [Candidatus Shapirobacteria bacterium]|nr:glycosyltransferase [Candidatus Shapirobacteria bacterium]
NLFSPPKTKPGPKRKNNFFLIVSRLEPQKRIDLVIKVFNDLGWPLIIVGSGSWEKKLKRLAQNNISLLGYLPDKKLVKYYQNARAVIFPQEEDFGLVALEAQACQTPVIAYRAGGATETIKNNLTGCFFTPQTASALKKTLLNWSENDYNRKNCRSWVKKFSQERFVSSWQKLISNLC